MALTEIKEIKVVVQSYWATVRDGEVTEIDQIPTRASPEKIKTYNQFLTEVLEAIERTLPKE